MMKRDCLLVQELYPQYKENELSPDLRQEIEAHLSTCEECRTVYEEEEGFRDLIKRDSELIQPDPSLDERLKQQLQRGRYYRYLKKGFIIMASIVIIYMLFFRFTFIIGSTDMYQPGFHADYQRIEEKLGISREAGITGLRLTFNAAGHMEQFRTRIVDFYETHLDLYDITFSPRIDGFHTYRVKRSRIDDPVFIERKQASISAHEVFYALDLVDYSNILAEIDSPRFTLSTGGERHEIEVRDDLYPDRDYYLLSEEGVIPLTAGERLTDVIYLALHSHTEERGYIFKSKER